MSHLKTSPTPTAVETAPSTGVSGLSGLENEIRKLAKAGGFSFFESTIDGVQNLNPDRKARKQIFLTDAEKKKERQDLKKKLDTWLDLLQATQSVTDMIEESQQQAEQANALLKRNLKKTLERT